MRKIYIFIVSIIFSIGLVSCSDYLREDLYAYSQSGQPVAIRTQANDNSSVVKWVPNGAEIEDVDWALDNWMHGSYKEDYHRDGYIYTTTYTGFIRRDQLSLRNGQPLPKKNKKLSGWKRKMDNHYVVRGKKSVPIMDNRREWKDEYGVWRYTYDTIGWLAPNTILRSDPDNHGNRDYERGEWFFTVSAPDSINGFVFGYHLKEKNTALVSRIFWWAYYSDPADNSWLSQWKARHLASWKYECRKNIYDESRTVWNRYRWHFWGLLLWLLVSFAAERFTYIFRFFWNIIVPWFYIQVMPEYFWYASPSIVGWWCILGFAMAVGIFMIFWRRLVSSAVRIFLCLTNLRIVLMIYYICYAIAMAIVCLNIFVGALTQDIIFLMIFFVFAMIPASTSGVGDADRVEIVDEWGKRIGGRFDGDRVYGDDGKTYKKIDNDNHVEQM